MHTDPDLARLLAIPGDYDLSAAQVADVLQLSPQTIVRLAGTGEIEAKRHAARGCGKRRTIRIPRPAVVRYLVKSTTGDRAALLAAIALQCPQWLQIAQGTEAPLPDNVIPMKPRGRRLPMTQNDPRQLDLFDAHSHLPAALDLLPARKA